jgi:hypothetical protein
VKFSICFCALAVSIVGLRRSRPNIVDALTERRLETGARTTCLPALGAPSPMRRLEWANPSGRRLLPCPVLGRVHSEQVRATGQCAPVLINVRVKLTNGFWLYRYVRSPGHTNQVLPKLEMTII